MNNELKIGVVIVSYNRYSLLERLLRSISMQQSDYRVEIVIVDNASDLQTRTFIEQLPDDIIKIFNSKNLGWAAAVNIGIKQHLKINCNYFIICNDDIWFENSHLFDIIISRLQQNNYQHIGIAGAEIVSQYGNKYYYTYGRDVFSDVFSQKIGFNSAKFYFKNMDNRLIYADFTDGCFFVVKEEVIKKIGFLDEDFFMYYEETDFCCRAWMKGIACAIFGDLSINHNPDINYVDNTFTLYWKSRNFILFLKKNKFWIFQIFWRILYYQLVKTVKIITRKKRYKGNIFYLWFALWKGTFNGLVKKVNK